MARLSGAALRAIFVMILVSIPSMIVPGTSVDASQVVALVAIFAAAFVIAEYSSTYPSLVEFRDAPPFNRIRFGALFCTIIVLSIILRGKTDPTTLTQLFEAIGAELGAFIDFPLSPVRLIILMLPPDATAETVQTVRIAAGLSYLCSITALGLFVLILRLRGWPSRRVGFNVWINLPTFDPTAGGDVVNRLHRDGQLNLLLGFLMPFIIPAFVSLAADLFDPVTLTNPHTLIWTMTAWAFLSASLLMRGIALSRVATMITEQRKRAHAATHEGLLPA